jgi:hypothetical protein
LRERIIYRENQDLCMSETAERTTTRVPMEIKCSIEGDLRNILLIFSSDNGKNWYEIDMIKDGNEYKMTIPNLIPGTRILYVFKGFGADGEEFLEDNSGQFYTQIAVDPNASAAPQKKDSPSPELQIPSPEIETTANQQELVDNSLPIPEEKISEENEAKIEDSPVIDEPPSIESPEPELPPSASEQSAQKPSKLREIGVPDSAPETKKVGISPPAVQFASPITQTSANKPDIVRPKPQPAIPEKSRREDENTRPITAYNPFSIEDGEIGAPPTVAETFSKIMGARHTGEPQKKQSFVNRPQLENSRTCGQCKAILNQSWKLCPLCGTKAK